MLQNCFYSRNSKKFVLFVQCILFFYLCSPAEGDSGDNVEYIKL